MAIEALPAVQHVQWSGSLRVSAGHLDGSRSEGD
jgi:hypothetical protein